MGCNRKPAGKVKNDQVTGADGRHLQKTLFNAANQALVKAMETDEVTPALLSSIHKIVSDIGVVLSSLDEQANSHLWSRVDSLKDGDLSFLE